MVSRAGYPTTVAILLTLALPARADDDGHDFGTFSAGVGIEHVGLFMPSLNVGWRPLSWLSLEAHLSSNIGHHTFLSGGPTFRTSGRHLFFLAAPHVGGSWGKYGAPLGEFHAYAAVGLGVAGDGWEWRLLGGLTFFEDCRYPDEDDGSEAEVCGIAPWPVARSDLRWTTPTAALGPPIDERYLFSVGLVTEALGIGVALPGITISARPLSWLSADLVGEFDPRAMWENDRDWDPARLLEIGPTAHLFGPHFWLITGTHAGILWVHYRRSPTVSADVGFEYSASRIQIRLTVGARLLDRCPRYWVDHQCDYQVAPRASAQVLVGIW